MKKLGIVLVGVLLLLPYSVFGAELRYGMKNNEEVRQMQQFLKDNGYYKGDITGNFYSLTLAGVKKFQKANKLKITGVWNQASQDKMKDLLEVVDEIVAAPLADNSPTIPIGWVANGDGTFSPPVAPVVQPQPVASVWTPPAPIIYGNSTPQTTQPTVSVSNPQPVDAPTDNIPPKVVFYGFSHVDVTPDRERKSLGSKAVFWNSNVTVGNLQNNCENCLVIKTDEPTKLKLQYLEGVDNNSWDPKTNANQIQTLVDDTLTDTHILMLKNYFKPFRSIYSFGFAVSDKDGNETKMNFPLSKNWGGWILSYDPAIDDSFTVIDNVKINY